MKKRTKKVLSFGVAGIMAASALPINVLPVSASVGVAQTANGGTNYDFVLKEEGTGLQTIEVSKDEVAAGDVSKRLDLYIDSTDWADDAYIKMATLNWTTTTGATLADGGEINNQFYYSNVLNGEKRDAAASDKLLPNGETVNIDFSVLRLKA